MTEEKQVQKTVTYQTICDDLTEAWSFIMDAIEHVGPDPSVHIHPATNAPPEFMQAIFGMQPQEVTRKFHVAVEGTVVEAREKVSTL